MKIRVGFELAYECPQSTPMVLMLNVHPSRATDLVRPDHLHIAPMVPVTRYVDAFGNLCSRLVAPPGVLQIAADAVVADCGLPDVVAPDARQHEVGELPHEALVFLLGSRYCETERLMNVAWSLFGSTPTGWARVQAICDFVHSHVRFGYPHARATRTAADTFDERRGVCRDFAHLAALPLHEHPGALLHRLSRRHRHSAGARADGFQISAPGSRSISAAAGTPSMPGTTCPASAAS
jgi:transglutaminase-like putative cysteine protease